MISYQHSKLKASMLLLSVLIQFSITASAAVDASITDLLNDTITHLVSQHDPSVTRDQALHVLSSLKGAIVLSFNFFKQMFGWLFKLVMLILWPAYWLISVLWSILIAKPWDLCTRVAKLFFPFTMFCIAAVCCGLFIGSCAGFAAEAFSSILITATWGSQQQQVQSKEKSEKDKQNLVERLRSLEVADSDDEEEEEEEEEEEGQKSSSSRLNSRSGSGIWESSSAFFGSIKKSTTPITSTSDRKKGKEPIRINSDWRDHATSSTGTSRSSSPPLLIRRIKMSSTTSERNNSWEWDEGEDDDRSSFNKKHL